MSGISFLYLMLAAYFFVFAMVIEYVQPGYNSLNPLGISLLFLISFEFREIRLSLRK